jgi:2-amino-4-hydroxy-6-hydroxymethyldihydropteridine diphosphokinase
VTGDGEDAFVSLGTNLGDRAGHLVAALRALAGLPGTSLLRLSPVFETDPVGPPPQGRFLNAVAWLRTTLAPDVLLAALLEIEAQAGRVRGAERWAARSLDLDLLLFGSGTIHEPGLEVPHPRLAERPFVLEPLAALAPALYPPGLGASVADLAARVRDPRAVRPWPGDDAAFRARLPRGARSRRESAARAPRR